jgi:hypothetical protein
MDWAYSHFFKVHVKHHIVSQLRLSDSQNAPDCGLSQMNITENSHMDSSNFTMNNQLKEASQVPSRDKLCMFIRHLQHEYHIRQKLKQYQKPQVTITSTNYDETIEEPQYLDKLKAY